MLLVLFIMGCVVVDAFGQYSCSLCGTANLSCVHQIWPRQKKPPTACQVFHYNDTVCHKKHIAESYSAVDYGYVKLEPFVNKSRTAFNISLYEIKWKTFRMRFKQRDGNLTKCRDFAIFDQEAVPLDSILYYDCPFSDARYEGTDLEFDYEYGVDGYLTSRKFIFTVPKHELIDSVKQGKSYLFTYVDVSDLNELTLRFRNLSSDSHVTVWMVRTQNDKIVKFPEMNKSNAMAVHDELHFRHKTGGAHGKYYFQVKFCEQGQCNLTKSATVYIPKNTVPQTVGIVIVSGMLVLVLLFFLYICRMQSVRDGELFRSQQHVLLVYSPSDEAHFEVVKALADVLVTVYKTNVLIDIEAVPTTKTKDPFEWFVDAFGSATEVVFIVSPAHTQPTKSVYKDIDNLAVHLMKQELAKPETPKTFSVLMFPYCQVSVPKELRSLKKYHFHTDFHQFLNFLFRRSVWEKLEERLLCPRPLQYEALRAAVQAAGTQERVAARSPLRSAEFVLPRDEPRVIRVESSFADGDADGVGAQPFLYDVQELLADAGRRNSDVPDECVAFDLRDLNLDGT